MNIEVLIRRLVRKLIRSPVYYSGDNPFEDLAKHGLVASDKKGLISLYISPEGYFECRFKSIKPWKLYEALNKIMFNTVLVSEDKFRGGQYDSVTRRVVQKIV